MFLVCFLIEIVLRVKLFGGTFRCHFLENVEISAPIFCFVVEIVLRVKLFANN
jgi:hypothetical protein